jgi:hypothetical protein
MVHDNIWEFNNGLIILYGRNPDNKMQYIW